MINQPIQAGSRHQSGSIVAHECNAGDLRISKTHTPGEFIIIERADIDDLMVVLDAMLGQRSVPT
jgi:hypothetical protein